MRMLLLGAAMGVLLHQRGVLVLHGSAIEVDGEACVFVGQRGWGKSTLAAGMVERGYRLLADDVVAIDFDGNGAPTVLPAFPQLKLWPDAIAALGRDPRRLRRLSSGFNKRERRVRAGFRTSPVRLRHVFVLAGGPCVEVEATQPHVALLDIIANLYVARFGTELLDRRRGEHLPLCAEIGRNVPICRLNRPSDLQLIPPTVELVRRHIASHSCTRAA